MPEQWLEGLTVSQSQSGAGKLRLQTLKLLELQLKRTIRSILGAAERACWWLWPLGHEVTDHPRLDRPDGSVWRLKAQNILWGQVLHWSRIQVRCISKSKKQSGNGDDSKSSFLKASSKNTPGLCRIYCCASCKEERVPSGALIFHQRRVSQGSWAVDSCLRSAPPQNRRLLSIL